MFVLNFCKELWYHTIADNFRRMLNQSYTIGRVLVELRASINCVFFQCRKHKYACILVIIQYGVDLWIRTLTWLLKMQSLGHAFKARPMVAGYDTPIISYSLVPLKPRKLLPQKFPSLRYYVHLYTLCSVHVQHDCTALDRCSREIFVVGYVMMVVTLSARCEPSPCEYDNLNVYWWCSSYYE